MFSPKKKIYIYILTSTNGVIEIYHDKKSFTIVYNHDKISFESVIT